MRRLATTFLIIALLALNGVVRTTAQSPPEELAAHFPAELEGIPLFVEAAGGAEWVGQRDPDDPGDAALIRRAHEVVDAMDRDLGDMTVATAIHEPRPGAISTIAAVRVDGVAATSLVHPVLRFLAAGIEEPWMRGRSIAGHAALIVRDRSMPGSYPVTLIPAGDTVWVIQADAPLRDEIAAALPRPSLATDSEQVSCVSRLLAAPIEDVTLPDDWRWDWVTLGNPFDTTALTTVTGRLSRPGSEARAWLGVSCEPETARLLERAARLRMRSGATELAVDPIGDASIALSEPNVDSSADDTVTTILWRDGRALGRVFTSADLDPDALADIVRRVSDRLRESGLGPTTSTDADGCLPRLLDAPLEELALPEGWTVRRMALGTYPFMSSPTTWVGWLDGGGEGLGVTLTVSCEPNADLLLERTAEIAQRTGGTELDLGAVGDATVAVETVDADGDRAGAWLVWRIGDAVGTISAEADGPDLDALVPVARGVSDVLGRGGLSDARASDPGAACERRLLEAPLETLHDTGQPWDGPYPGLGTVPSAWVSGSYMRSFTLTCVPEADLVMERDTRMRLRSGLVILEVGPIGDRSVATGEEDGGLGTYILWRNGEVLGRVELGPFESLETMARFAQQANELLD